jgi:hypothetical protein
MPEPLLAGSGVKLFGRIVAGLTLDPAAMAGGEADASLRRLAAKLGDAPRLARIYGFSHEGQYYDLARPTIFLVDGEGRPCEDGVASTGVAVEPPEFADGLLVWDYDRSDFSVRIDVDVGSLERILLEAELGLDEQLRATHGRQNIRMGVAGQSVRLRYAGQSVRSQGGGRGGGLSD